MNKKELNKVEEKIKEEKNPDKLKELRYERRLVYLDMFWDNEINFKEFSELINKAKHANYPIKTPNRIKWGIGKNDKRKILRYFRSK